MVKIVIDALRDLVERETRVIIGADPVKLRELRWRRRGFFYLAVTAASDRGKVGNG